MQTDHGRTCEPPLPPHFGPSSFSDVLVSNVNVLTCPLLSPLSPHATPLLISLFPEERTHRLLSQLPLHEHPGPIRPIALGQCGRDHQAHSPAGFPLAGTCPLSPPLSYWPNFFKEHFLLVLFYSFTLNSVPFGFNLFCNLENARLSPPPLSPPPPPGSPVIQPRGTLSGLTYCSHLFCRT